MAVNKVVNTTVITQVLLITCLIYLILPACQAASQGDQWKELDVPISSYYLIDDQIKVSLLGDSNPSITLQKLIGRNDNGVCTLYTESVHSVPLAIAVRDNFRKGGNHKTMQCYPKPHPDAYGLMFLQGANNIKCNPFYCSFGNTCAYMFRGQFKANIEGKTYIRIGDILAFDQDITLVKWIVQSIADKCTEADICSKCVKEEGKQDTYICLVKSGSPQDRLIRKRHSFTLTEDGYEIQPAELADRPLIDLQMENSIKQDKSGTADSTESDESEKPLEVWIIVIIVVGPIAVLGLIVSVVCCLKKRRSERFSVHDNTANMYS